MTFHVPEKFRVKERSSVANGNNGLFEFYKNGHVTRCVASDGLGWEHVSVSIQGKKMPGWNLMCYVKDLFWDKSDIVIQYHPAEEDYINFHPACLHLWKPINQTIPVPNSILVGPKK